MQITGNEARKTLHSTQGIKQQTRLAKTPYHSQAQVSRLELNNKKTPHSLCTG
ncbi:hypothetical protein KSS87_001539, partial [Heliosperma pusillum]